MTEVQDKIRRLPPEILHNSAATTQGKLWKLFADQVDEISVVGTQLKLLLSPDALTGFNLDQLGTLLREARKGKSDADYRLFLKLAVQRIWSRGDINSINDLAAILGFTNINVEERFTDKPLDGLGLLDGNDLMNGDNWPARFFFWRTLGVNEASGDTYINETIDSVRAAGVRADILYSFLCLESEGLVYTTWSSVLDGAALFDGQTQMLPTKAQYTPDEIALGDGAEPGGVLRPPEPSDTGLQNEVLRVAVKTLMLGGLRYHYIELDRATLAGTTINEMGIFLGASPIFMASFAGKVKDAFTKFKFTLQEED